MPRNRTKFPHYHRENQDSDKREYAKLAARPLACDRPLKTRTRIGWFACLSDSSALHRDKVNALNRSDIVRTARDFRWNRRLPPWTVIVNGTEYPVRPLVTQAA